MRCAIAVVVVLALALTAVQGFTISGKFIRQTKKDQAKRHHAETPVKIYKHEDIKTNKDIAKATPLHEGQTDKEGNFHFDIEDNPGAKYRVVGFKGNRTANMIVSDRTAGGSRRRRALCSGVSVTLADADIYSEEEWQIITQWIPCTGVSAVADFDAVTKVSYATDALSWKDSNDYVDTVPSYYSAAWLDTDASNSDSPYEGIESTFIWEEDKHTYDHVVYGYGSASSFVDSDLQVHVYKVDPMTYDTVLVASYLADDSPTFNSDWRFFHAFSVEVDYPNDAYTLTDYEEVTCDPNLSLGTTSTQSWENGNRNC